MSLYGRQVAQTRNAQPRKDKVLKLTEAEYEHLVKVLEDDLKNTDDLFRECKTSLLLDKCREQ